MDLKEEEILGDRAGEHWYYRAKAAALKCVLRGHRLGTIFDIGAGSGFFSRHLLEDPSADKSVCVDIGYENDSDDTTHAKPIAFRRTADAGEADTVLLMDVIEHVADEHALLKPYVDAAKPGTLFVVTVPAFQFMWSGHDVFLGHHRRYTRSQLVDTVQACGLEPVSSHYYYALVFPLALATRMLGRLAGGANDEPKSQLREEGPLINTVLGTLCTIERPWMGLNKLFGLTVFATFRKP